MNVPYRCPTCGTVLWDLAHAQAVQYRLSVQGWICLYCSDVKQGRWVRLERSNGAVERRAEPWIAQPPRPPGIPERRQGPITHHMRSQSRVHCFDRHSGRVH